MFYFHKFDFGHNFIIYHQVLNLKQIVVNISDYGFEKLRLLAILEKKSVSKIIAERITGQGFPSEVEQAFDMRFTKEFNKLLREN